MYNLMLYLKCISTFKSMQYQGYEYLEYILGLSWVENARPSRVGSDMLDVGTVVSANLRGAYTEL